VCGCTDLDCSRCVARTGVRCSWVKGDLCSACCAPSFSSPGPWKLVENTRLHRGSIDFQIVDRLGEPIGSVDLGLPGVGQSAKFLAALRANGRLFAASHGLFTSAVAASVTMHTAALRLKEWSDELGEGEGDRALGLSVALAYQAGLLKGATLIADNGGGT
jgi:hypothetical protein